MADKPKPLQGMQNALGAKRKQSLAQVGAGKPSPRIDMSGKRMTPKGLPGAPFPSTPSLPIPTNGVNNGKT